LRFTILTAISRSGSALDPMKTKRDSFDVFISADDGAAEAQGNLFASGVNKLKTDGQ